MSDRVGVGDLVTSGSGGVDHAEAVRVGGEVYDDRPPGWYTVVAWIRGLFVWTPGPVDVPVRTWAHWDGSTWTVWRDELAVPSETARQGTSSGPHDRPRLEHCRDHDDCRAMAELARACWLDRMGAT